MIPLSWTYRALLLLQFTSDDPRYANGVGEQILRSNGILYKGEPFTREWIYYCFVYLLMFLFVCMIASAACLHYFRMDGAKQGTKNLSDSKEKDNEIGEEESKNDAQVLNADFTPVNLTFKNLCYEVESSTGSESLRLLNNVSGVFSAGRLCALMGESGAGKTTLMDVIALRKGSGTITGDVVS